MVTTRSKSTPRTGAKRKDPPVLDKNGDLPEAKAAKAATVADAGGGDSRTDPGDPRNMYHLLEEYVGSNYDQADADAFYATLRKTPVTLEDLKFHNVDWDWTGSDDFVYNTALGSVMRRFYMDSMMEIERVDEATEVWDANQSVSQPLKLVRLLFRATPLDVTRAQLREFVSTTVDGLALLQGHAAGRIAIEDVMFLAGVWAQHQQLRTPIPDLSQAAGQDLPPKGAVRYVSNDDRLSGALAEWKEIVDNGAEPPGLNALPPLIPLPRTVGEGPFGLDRTPGGLNRPLIFWCILRLLVSPGDAPVPLGYRMITCPVACLKILPKRIGTLTRPSGIKDPYADAAKVYDSGQVCNYDIEDTISDAAVVAMEAALVEDDKLVLRTVRNGATVRKGYHVEGEYLVDELDSEYEDEPGATVWRQRTKSPRIGIDSTWEGLAAA